MDNLFEKYADLSIAVNVAENNRRNCVNKIVETLQNKTELGYVKFTEYTGFPTFYDETINQYETIVGAKVVDNYLYITTDVNFDSMSWFDWTDYGELFLDDFIFIIQQSLAQNLL